MPGIRRSRARALLWTHHKSKSSYHDRQFEAPSATPTGSDWEALEQLGSFIIGKETGEEEKFCLNDTVTVVPPGTRLKSKNSPLEVEQLWIAKIKEIRVDVDGQVWVKVNWYYSPSDVREHMPSFDVSRCSKYERIYSHHSEVISAFTLYRPLPMVDFLEDDPDQVPILSNQFFCRSYFDTKTFRVHRYVCDAGMQWNSSTPKSSGSSESRLCICGESYNPDDKDTTKEMHWCPRPRCRRAYHRSCLEDGHHIRLTSSDESIIHLRLASSADTDHSVALPHDRTLLQLPLNLLVLAAQPIVRGGAHGVAGNVAVVVHARRLVHAAIQEQKSISSDSDSGSDSSEEAIDAGYELHLNLDYWEQDTDFNGWEDAIVERNLSLEDDNTGAEVHICPVCEGAI
ncbi:hypothetical protein B0H11DRAFT_1980974 [Mycena galericulata]|nr:hypothetical protein B0H11DRAFT_1980974 [Mycena galericulata]